MQERGDRREGGKGGERDAKRKVDAGQGGGLPYRTNRRAVKSIARYFAPSRAASFRREILLTSFRVFWSHPSTHALPFSPVLRDLSLTTFDTFSSNPFLRLLWTALRSFSQLLGWVLAPSAPYFSRFALLPCWTTYVIRTGVVNLKEKLQLYDGFSR